MHIYLYIYVYTCVYRNGSQGPNYQGSFHEQYALQNSLGLLKDASLMYA